jgi:transposase
MLYLDAAWRQPVRVATEIVLTSGEQAELARLARSKRTSLRLAQRARIVLLAAQGLQNKDIAVQLSIGRVQVSRWRERYAQSRLAGIERDLPRGAPPVTVDVARLVELTTQSKPEAATHWSTRTMAAELGTSASSVSRHWRKNGLEPHLGWRQLPWPVDDNYLGRSRLTPGRSGVRG